jgi:hypothetical protein
VGSVPLRLALLGLPALLGLTALLGLRMPLLIRKISRKTSVGAL